jgi:hypothetical protein
MAGLGAYGGAGLAGGLMSAGAQNVAGETLAKEGIAAGESVPANFAETAGRTATPAQINTAMTATPNTELLSKGVGSLGQSGGFTNLGSTMAASGGPSLGRAGLAAAAPALAGMMAPQNEAPTAPAGDSTMPQRLKYNVGRPTDAAGNPTTPAPDVPGYGGGMGQDFGRERNYFPTAGYQNITPEEAKQMRGYADGGMPTSAGPVERMSNQNAIGANTGYPGANINHAAYATPYQTPVSQNVVSGPQDVGVNSMTGEMNEFANGGSVQNFAFGGFAQAAEQVNGGGGGSSSAASGNVFDGGMAKLVEKLRAEGKLANGGLSAAYAAGGMSHLGDYSDGGRLLKGPGDGVSDSIPAVIGNKRPARLADGEFVVPARIVSELGNGSTEAGARKLYAMLDRVQAVRKKSIGKGKVAKNSRADNLLPA